MSGRCSTLVKTNLPVILLKGIILLPENEVRLEFDKNVSKDMIDLSELFHDNRILVITPDDPLEEHPALNELPKLGVVASISRKIELPDGRIRLIIKGIERARVLEYVHLNQDKDVIEAVIEPVILEQLDDLMTKAFIKKITRELERYIHSVSYMSNSILSVISSVTSLDTLTDLVAPCLPLSYERLSCYLREDKASVRARMILEDILEEEQIFEIEKQIDQKVKNRLEKNQREYILEEKIKAMKEELGKGNAKEEEVRGLLEKLHKGTYPEAVFKRIQKEISYYEGLPMMSSEAGILKSYIDTLLQFPWNLYTEDNHDLQDVKNKLDQTHYGLTQVKTRIIEYLAVMKFTGNLQGSILCLVGPPGVGKTSLAIQIAQALHREFAKISVGGIHDEGEIKGHRKTYIGASPGRIIRSMQKANRSNPVLLIDEIDKMSKDIHGDPASALLDVLDPTQNMHFSDHYIEEEVDLSQVLFIATANSIEDIPAPLLDRLEVIELSSYTEFEKLDIAKKHLLPKICREHGLDVADISIEDEAILAIIRYYTKEAGVRELERLLASIVRKIVTSMVMYHKKMQPLEITEKKLERYLGKKKYHEKPYEERYQVGVVTGLAYTSFGGDTLPIEVNHYEGNGNLVLTGSLGEVMKESAKIALSYIKSNHKLFRIDYSLLTNRDIHIHVPEGATPKDGPSAGIALTTALISALTGTKVDQGIGMTGEITLRGEVLPIGGLKEKCMGAHRNGIHTIILPEENYKDLEEIPKEVKDSITFITVKNYKEVWKRIFKEDRKVSPYEQEQLLL